MNLDDFRFPVIERPVAVHNGRHDLSDWENNQTYLPGDYKAIVREDTNQLISIVRNSYKVVPNGQLIDELLSELTAIDTPYRVDPSHSFVNNSRMRLQVTFPEITMHDEDSEIALSLYLHNSYDQSEGVRLFWGALRGICTNGMVFGKLLSKFYGRHTKGFSIGNVRKALEQTYETLPALQQRIDTLREQTVTTAMLQDVEKKLGKRIANLVEPNQAISQWMLLNAITWYVSHEVKQKHRARYQMQVSKLFDL